MKKSIIIVVFTCLFKLLPAQNQTAYLLRPTDSLKLELAATKNDTLRLVLANQLRYAYFFVKGNVDSALFYSKQVLSLAQKLGYKIDEAYACDLVGDILNYQHHPHTLETFFKGVTIAEDPKVEAKILPRNYLERMTYWHPDLTNLLVKNNWEPRYFRLAILASLYTDLAHAYAIVMPNQQRLMFYVSKAIELCKAQKDSLNLAYSYSVAAEYFFATDQLDSSLLYAQQSNTVLAAYKRERYISELQEAATIALLGAIYFKKGNDELAIKLLRQSIQQRSKDGLQIAGWLAYATLSDLFSKKGLADSSFYYGIKAYEITQTTGLPEEMQKTSALLAALYKKAGAKDSALKYFELSAALNDSVNNADKKRKLQGQDFEEQFHQQELQAQKAKEKVYLMLSGLVLSVIITLFLLWNNRQRRKAYDLVQQQKMETVKAYEKLKATQAQLIQKEKMASLGELTAGIAHEIQNPLNFVNNFSAVNRELVVELKQEAQSGNIEEVLSLAGSIEENEEKINHHGRRADSIVKGMLQHSRSVAGEKQPTDINQLVEEHLRMAYHGYRAKDQGFNADISTDYDPNVEQLSIVPQEIGRVLLNLFNNAFYAVSEKKQQLNGTFEPTVSVSTRKAGEQVLITVRDNGIGMPEKIIEKIFQPFFTTKPTGEGTGLGLSLSYDIVTKGHGGELKVQSKEGESSMFVVQLPQQTTM